MAKASILIFVSLNLISFATSAKLVKVYKSCELTSSNKSVAPDYLCNVEHTSSSNAFVNIQATFVRPLFDMIMNYEVKYKVNQNKFRTVIKFDDIKICEYLNGTSIHPVVQVLISKIVKIFKSGLHPCPYEGTVSFSHLALTDSGQPWLRGPTGYKAILSLHDPNDENILTVVLNSEYEDLTKNN